MSVRRKLIGIGAMLALSACSSSGSGGGAMVGSFVAPTAPSSAASASIVAAMGGGLVGRVAPGLGDGNLRRALEAEYRALEHTPGGQAVTWSGGSGGASGEVIAYQPYRVGSQDCRQYSHTIVAGAVPQTARGAACRNPDGSWSPLI